MRAHRRLTAGLALLLTITMCAHSRASAPAAPAIVIDPGANFVLGPYARLVTPVNILNSGTLSSALNSEVILTGSGDLLISGVPAINYLTMAMTGTAAIDVPLHAGLLTLTSGKLWLNGHELLADGVLGGSASSYVVTPDTLGRLAQSITMYGPVLFPVGHSTYDPITIQPASGTDRAYVAVMDVPPTTGLIPSAAMSRAWLVRHLNAPGANGDLTIGLGWNLGEQGVNFDRTVGHATSAQAYRWLNGAWVLQPGARASRSITGSIPPLDTLLTQATGLWTLASPAALGVDSPGAGEAPRGIELAQNTPNPCTRAAAIRFGLPQRARVSLGVYTVLGERVATLVQGEQEPGWHTATFDSGRLPGGIYFYRLDALGRTLSRKLIVVR